MSSGMAFVVSALVRDGGRILLVQERGPDDPVSTWMLPGGKVEPGETLTEALGRELAEETGLEVEANPPIAFIVEIVGKDERYIALTFDCTTRGEVHPDDPDGLVLDAAWLTAREALSRLSTIAWYDCVPLERFLSGDAQPGASYVLNRP